MPGDSDENVNKEKSLNKWHDVSEPPFLQHLCVHFLIFMIFSSSPNTLSQWNSRRSSNEKRGVRSLSSSCLALPVLSVIFRKLVLSTSLWIK